jgi:hypothetical protein
VLVHWRASCAVQATIVAQGKRAAPTHPPQRRTQCSAAGECTTAGGGLHLLLADGDGAVACYGCAPETLASGGLYLRAWHGAHGPRGYAIAGEVALALPNSGARPALAALGGAIVLVFRGSVAFVDIVGSVQEAGGVGLVIIDDGSCGEELECGGWLGSISSGAGLAARDPSSAWARVRIPYVLISKGSGVRLLDLLRPSGLGTRSIPGLGEQLVMLLHQ